MSGVFLLQYSQHIYRQKHHSHCHFSAEESPKRQELAAFNLSVKKNFSDCISIFIYSGFQNSNCPFGFVQLSVLLCFVFLF